MSTTQPKKPIYIASDHAGVDVKSTLIGFLEERGFTVEDLGPNDTTSVDYPDFAHKLGRKVVEGDTWGVLVCGSGIGMSIAANKVEGVRAALVHNSYTARMAREHNDANVVVLGARAVGVEVMKSALDAYIGAAFDAGDDGRHARRVSKLAP